MATTASSSGGNAITVVIVVAVIAIVAIAAMYLMQDHRTGSERVGDAVAALPHGVGKAADKLGDQPPAVNVVNNAKDAVKKAN